MGQLRLETLESELIEDLIIGDIGEDEDAKKFLDRIPNIDKLPGQIIDNRETGGDLAYQEDGLTFHRSSYSPHKHLLIEQPCPTCQASVRLCVSDLNSLGKNLSQPNKELCGECYEKAEAAQEDAWRRELARAAEPTAAERLLAALASWIKEEVDNE